jgi:hypothetical protein
LRPGIPGIVLGNLFPTLSWNFGGRWLRHVETMYAKATAADWLLAAAAALLLTGSGLWLLRRAQVPGPPAVNPTLRQVFGLALLFSIAAYLPAWLWHLHPRLHYLPSAGLFAAVAACAARIARDWRPRLAQAAILLVLGGASLAFAAAGRGEARYWEEAFQMKKQLFAELRPDLAGKEILVLENFPTDWGPAYLLYPHDAENGPAMFFRDAASSSRPFAGDISSAPAPRGLFLYTFTYFHGPRSFRYYPTERFLIARFTSVENRGLRYEKNPVRPAPYRILASRIAPGEGPFRVLEASARRREENMLVALRLRATLRNRAWLAVVPGFAHHGEFHPWGYMTEGHMSGLAPVLLSDPDPNPRGGGYEWDITFELSAFPETDRVQLEFYETSDEQFPARLGSVETAVQS